MHSTLASLAQHTRHLEKLDGMAQTLKAMQESSERIENNLLSAATGRRQIPLTSHILMILVLGAALLIVVIDKSGKTVHIGMDGIEIGEKPQAKPNP